eukprot:TRINITY_DN5501_c1_g1_i1.p2 TRINITY_DN5501_c1_g1~~TRINITY_DN5501_c1_g1_i1.p2  ORF type:complete len:107 (-),score=5.75 TRINITY_DN5501_c1_g1_i1:344-664(-)
MSDSPAPDSGASGGVGEGHAPSASPQNQESIAGSATHARRATGSSVSGAGVINPASKAREGKGMCVCMGIVSVRVYVCVYQPCSPHHLRSLSLSVPLLSLSPRSLS